MDDTATATRRAELQRELADLGGPEPDTRSRPERERDLLVGLASKVLGGDDLAAFTTEYDALYGETVDAPKAKKADKPETKPAAADAARGPAGF